MAVAYSGVIADSVSYGIELQMLMDPGRRLMYAMYTEHSNLMNALNVQPIKSAEITGVSLTKDHIALQFSMDLKSSEVGTPKLKSGMDVGPLMDLLNLEHHIVAASVGDDLPLTIETYVTGEDCGCNDVRNCDVIVVLLPDSLVKMYIYWMDVEKNERNSLPYVIVCPKL